MGRRRQKRLSIALPVTVSGLDTNGNPFIQSANTVDISPRGIRLRGLRCLRAPGDLIWVEHKHKKAQYRVAWLGQVGICDDVGLESLDGANVLFGEHLPASCYPFLSAEQDSYSGDAAAIAVEASVANHAAERRESDRRHQERRQQERRRHPRFNCAGTARIWEADHEHDVGGRINEISVGGCYVEMMSPLRVGEGIHMQLALRNRTIRLEAIVRYSQPNFGMGVEFTKMALSEVEKLHRVVAELSGDVPAEAQSATASPVARPDKTPDKELGEALLRWFGSHHTLTRQDFLGLLEEMKRVNEELTKA